MPVITTATLTVLGKHLAKKGIEKAFDTSVGEISKGAINWIKKLFAKEGKVRQELVDLQEKPESAARINAVNAIIERDLEENPESISFFNELLEKLSMQTSVNNSKNVNTGKINSEGGDIHLGDNYGK